MNKTEIFERLDCVPGRLGFYYKNLVTGEVISRGESAVFEGASVIKLPIYAAIMKLAHEGRVEMSERLVCRAEDKLPSCGALRLIEGDIELDIRSLCRLMIAISDNSATNMLIRRFGIDALNAVFTEIGFERTRIERLLFDSEAAARGCENRICLKELATLLEGIYRGSYLSEELSREMESTLLSQQINHKIPGYLNRRIPVAHKTGEDTGITNDVGIVYAREPFIICFAANQTDAAQAETAMREISLALSGLE